MPLDLCVKAVPIWGRGWRGEGGKEESRVRVEGRGGRSREEGGKEEGRGERRWEREGRGWSSEEMGEGGEGVE